MTQEELTEVFRALGASRPESWAASQIDEGIPQLARFVFLKQAWERLLRDGDTSWVAKEIASAARDPQAPYAGLGHALQRLVEAGASLEDLTEIGRCLQAQALFSIGYLIDGPAYAARGTDGLDWRLFQVDEDGKPYGEPIEGLHESVLETDPAGREMRPKKSG